MTPKDKPERTGAWILCRASRTACSSTLLLDQARQRLDARDSAFLLELVYGTLRNRARLDWALNQFSAQPVEKTDAWTRNILRLGAYQMLFLDRVPVSAAVNTSTELAKAYGKKQGYVNGLLRNLDRKRSSIVRARLMTIRSNRLAIRLLPSEWLVRRWVARFGAEQTEMLLRGEQPAAPLVDQDEYPQDDAGQGSRTALEAEGVNGR